MSNHWLEYILANPTKEWSWEYISANPNIRWDDIIRNPNLPWKYDFLSRNPNITVNIINSNIHLPWSFEQLSKNPNITLDFVKKYPNIPWCYQKIIKNKSVTYADIENNINFFMNKIDMDEEHLYYSLISKNQNISLSNVLSNPNKKWNYKYLSKHINLTWDTINTSKDWSYYYLSRNPNLLSPDMKDIIMLDKYMEGYLQNPNLGIVIFSIDNLIKNNNFSDLYFSYISKNPLLKFEDVEKHKEKPWDYNNLSKNPMYAYETYKKKETYLIEI
jgi:hypothetical protein